MAWLKQESVLYLFSSYDANVPWWINCSKGVMGVRSLNGRLLLLLLLLFVVEVEVGVEVLVIVACCACDGDDDESLV